MGYPNVGTPLLSLYKLQNTTFLDLIFALPILHNYNKPQLL